MYFLFVLGLAAITFFMARDRGIGIGAAFLASLFAPISTFILLFIPKK